MLNNEQVNQLVVCLNQLEKLLQVFKDLGITEAEERKDIIALIPLERKDEVMILLLKMENIVSLV